MTTSTLDIMTKVETLDTEDLEDVLLWVEFTLSKRNNRRQAMNIEELYFAYLYANATQEARSAAVLLLARQELPVSSQESHSEIA